MDIISIGFEQVSWVIDDTATETVANIRRKWRINGTEGRKLHIEKISISGPQSQLECLMQSIGISTIHQSVTPSLTEEDFRDYFNV